MRASYNDNLWKSILPLTSWLDKDYSQLTSEPKTLTIKNQRRAINVKLTASEVSPGLKTIPMAERLFCWKTDTWKRRKRRFVRTAICEQL